MYLITYLLIRFHGIYVVENRPGIHVIKKRMHAKIRIKNKPAFFCKKKLLWKICIILNSTFYWNILCFQSFFSKAVIEKKCIVFLIYNQIKLIVSLVIILLLCVKSKLQEKQGCKIKPKMSKKLSLRSLWSIACSEYWAVKVLTTDL